MKLACRKGKGTAVALLVSALLFCVTLLPLEARADGSAPKGIQNNGLGGITINIQGAYYKALAKQTGYAYTRGGCAWYAGARASELTGRNLGVHSPASWWSTYASQFGFPKSSKPVAKGLAVFSNHIVVVEAVQGDTLLVSEGSNPGSSDASHGYCCIRRVNRQSFEKSNYKGQSLKGYIDLKVRGDNGPLPETVPEDRSGVYVAQGRVDGRWHAYRGDKVAADYTGIAPNKYGGWWRVVSGDVQFDAKGVFRNEHGWWCVRGGKVDFSYYGVARNNFGWWKIQKGKVDFDFTGVADNEYGTWYLEEGKVDFSKEGEVFYEGTLYDISGGAATEIL